MLYIYKITSKCRSQTTLSLELGAEITTVTLSRGRKRFEHPLLIITPATITQSAQTTIPPYQH